MPVVGSDAVFIEAVFTIKPVDFIDVNEDKDHEAKNRTLLGHPETQFESEKTDVVQNVREQDGHAEGDHEPHRQERQREPDVFLPIDFSLWGRPVHCFLGDGRWMIGLNPNKMDGPLTTGFIDPGLIFNSAGRDRISLPGYFLKAKKNHPLTPMVS